jgi:hypothetical protein
MKVSVYDTYVTKKDGSIMHFDILVPEELKDELTVHRFGQEYLKSKGQEGQPLTSKECRFCHVEKATEKIHADIAEKGYSIIEIEGFNQ